MDLLQANTKEKMGLSLYKYVYQADVYMCTYITRMGNRYHGDVYIYIYAFYFVGGATPSLRSLSDARELNIVIASI